jgi:hypothetical protein
MRGLAVSVGALALLLGCVADALARPRPVAFVDCLRLPLVRPAEVVLACGDGTESFEATRWTHWTRRSARAVGTAEINDCTPSCVDGHVHHYRALLLLDRPRACGGRLMFTRGRLVFTTRHAAGQSVGLITLCPVA